MRPFFGFSVLAPLLSTPRLSLYRCAGMENVREADECSQAEACATETLC